MTLDEMDPARLIFIHEHWLQDIIAVMPYLGLRMAEVAGVEPSQDGHIRLGRSLQANARVDPGPEYIFHAGIFYALYDLAAELAVVPNFPGVPELQEPVTRPEPAVKHRYVNYTPTAAHPGREAVPSIPLNVPSGRVGVFGGLWLSALSFIYLHEQQHFLRGHLLYLEQEFQLSTWRESAGRSVQNRVDSLTSCALEWDADMNAVVSTLQAAFTVSNIRLSLFSQESVEQEIVVAVGGAMLAMAVLGASDRAVKHAVSSRLHPSPAYRVLCVLSVLRLFLDHVEIAEEKAASCIRMVVQIANLAFNKVGIYDDLEWALKMYVGDLEETHELQQERLRIVMRADAIQEKIEHYTEQINALFPEAIRQE
jgi:hypothetical protein